jgi:uncharacterized protein
MIINLLDIPQEGQSFTINRNLGDFNESLRDLIGAADYLCEFRITPMQSGTFDLQGYIQTNSHDDCSRCGDDFPMAIHQKFKEILMPELETPRNGFYAKANHFSDLKKDDLAVVEVRGHLFNMGDFVHEVVGLALPLNPAPPCDASGKCSLCHKDVSQTITYEDPGFEMPSNPFEALKNVKLNS